MMTLIDFTSDQSDVRPLFQFQAISENQTDVAASFKIQTHMKLTAFYLALFSILPSSLFGLIDYRTNRWRQLTSPSEGNIRQVTSSEIALWAVNNRGGISTCAKPCDGIINKWQSIPGQLVHISANNNYVFGVNAADEIFYCSFPCRGNWQMIPGRLVQLSSSNDLLYGVNRAGQIYFKDLTNGDIRADNWNNVRGTLSYVSVGLSEVWGTNSNGNIFKCAKPCLDGAWQSIQGILTRVEVSPIDDSVFGVNSKDEIFGCEPECNGGKDWKRLPGALRHVYGMTCTEIYGSNSQGTVWGEGIE